MKPITSVWVAFFASQSFATELVTPEKIEAAIEQVEWVASPSKHGTLAHEFSLERNLWNLNQIAKENGGNRAFGLPGYKASSDYVLERVQSRFGDQVSIHPLFITTINSELNLSNTILGIKHRCFPDFRWKNC